MTSVVVRAFRNNPDRVAGRDPILGINVQVTALGELDQVVDSILDDIPGSFVGYFRPDGSYMNYYEAVQELSNIEVEECKQDESADVSRGVVKVEVEG